MTTRDQPRRQAWIHIGTPGVGDVIGPALTRHHHALVELGVVTPRSATESLAAAVEVARGREVAGLRTVGADGAEEAGGAEGADGEWARLLRRAEAFRADLVLSHSLLGDADPSRVALLADALAGRRVHVVVSTGRSDVDEVLGRWVPAVRRPERLHLLETRGLAPYEAWRSFGRLAGFGTTSLRLDAVTHGPRSGVAPRHPAGRGLLRRRLSRV
ncbi:hypothetical protein KG112_08820 [Nocardioides sp. zg-ZUI104]|uniref:hypothetical protein n=1 Tax=Nocardioides faecalis TaxID=2803858 RepID=UPI001BCADFC3|nr:hypothetical protein [Nocardioides faecalis]MBS4752907.1 hypothetical protein [Nocardioides faecalis]